jgi:hypothetical protein
MDFHGMAGNAAALAGIAGRDGAILPPELKDESERHRLDLARAIDDLKPAAVHALGSHPAGFLAQDAMWRNGHQAPLVVHMRGGAEIELYRHSDAYMSRFTTLFGAASAVIRQPPELRFRRRDGIRRETNIGIPSTRDSARTVFPASSLVRKPETAHSGSNPLRNTSS